MCVLVEHVKDNYYARFHDPSHHSYREMHLSILRRHVKLRQSMECEM